MAIFLDDHERKYLLDLLPGSKWHWARDSILKKIKGDVKRLEKIKTCDHVWGTYLGQKVCCTKCNAYDVGMGESWSFEDQPTTTAVPDEAVQETQDSK